MLTETELNEMNAQIATLKETEKSLYKDKQNVKQTVKTTLTTWMLSLINAESLDINFDYECDYDFSTKPWTKIPKCHITIKHINGMTMSFGFFDIDVKQNSIEYSHSSNRFTITDKAEVLAYKLMIALIENEELLKVKCFEMFDKYDKIFTSIFETSAAITKFERQIEEDKKEKQHNEVLEKLHVGLIVSDGAGKGWYLKVNHISTAFVGCTTAKAFTEGSYDWTHHCTRPAGIYKISTRRIRKEDFIKYIISGYYKIIDVEIVED